jgi:pyruvate,water dikinase
MHWPDPVPVAIMSIAAEDGINAAATKYDAPIRFKARRINTYQYSQFSPPPVPPDELAAMGKRAEEKIGAAMARLGALWADEWLPEVKEHLAYWRGYDLNGASAAQLADHLEETQRRQRRVWDIHFEVGLPMLMSMSLFDEMYRDVLGAEGAFDSFKLLQGFENKTVESGTALWQLSREALRLPSVRAVLEEKAAEEVIPALAASDEGRAFLAKLNEYLDVYGRRSDKFDSLSYPSWIEDPTPVVKNLKDFVGQPDRDLVAERAALVAERDQAVAHARERLQGYPRQVREQFEFLLAAAQTGVVLSEDHGYWIDYCTMYEARQVLLACGRRLVAAGALERPDDTVHLSFEEIAASLRATPAIDRRALVAERKAEMAHFRAIQPPPVLGTMPAGPPPDDPMTRTMGKFFGAPPKPPTDPTRLEGAAGSPGKTVGTARVIRALSDAGRLGKGEILVAETTAPPWTPLFATAGAVVTDTGGILSHCAVVAREYGIPAVVGVGAATALIKDGQTIEVDGDAGTVRIVG